MKKYLLTIMIGMCCTGFVFSQSAFLDKGQSGFGIAGNFATNEDANSFGGAIAYSFSGILDLGAGISRVGYDQQFLGADLNATVISPFVSFIPIKQDDEIPLSIALNGAYEKQLYSNDVLDDNDIDFTGDFLNVGVSLFTDFQASESMVVQPKAGVTYITGESKLKSGGQTVTESDNTTVFDVGLSLVFDAGDTNLFVLTPMVFIQEDLTTFGFSLNFILPQKE
ncbi:hypothetical protein AB2B38_008510 [Balneola sp. MJW-20]|uniref:hypothetical protein n=1 Tax=Gracilimonas aurantiaca TaxID=3234185 RepID=UPI0034661064